MKKLLAILLVAAMCLSMSGCALIFSAAKLGADETIQETYTETEVIPDESSEAPVSEISEEESVNSLAGLESYSYSEGISLMMEEGMARQDTEDFTIYAYSNTAMFAAIKEDASVFSGAGLDIADYDLEEYAGIVQQGNGLDASFAKDEAGNLSVTYNSNQNGTDFFYYATVKQGSDSFWVVTFACFAEDEATYLPQFKIWAATINCD